ncbi:unnamed protein product [Paramecium sonneborni]|uniref:Uncharacterized protein n=1 Tax=Paramecium sonneborni TaxID=65129 RepID=A0A8S1MIM5_9CILI|nr:unnamed protein product [Paramecium sonneborni]
MGSQYCNNNQYPKNMELYLKMQNCKSLIFYNIIIKYNHKKKQKVLYSSQQIAVTLKNQGIYIYTQVIGLQIKEGRLRNFKIS